MEGRDAGPAMGGVIQPSSAMGEGEGGREAPAAAMSRRSLLGRLFAGTMAAGAGGVIASILAYLFPTESVRSSLGPRRVRVGHAADVPSGSGKLVLVDEEPVWILNLPRGFVGMSAFCTHKACVIKWRDSRRLFECPCHDGRFDEHGNVVSGPPRRALTHYRVALVGDEIYVSPRDERAF